MMFLKHPNIPLNTVRPGVLRTRWDFSRVSTTLIPSVAGKHEGWPAVIKSGHTALMRAVSRLNPQQRAVSLEYQVSLEMSGAAVMPHTELK
jgi:tyrosyl-DNA phosphodiesterase-1